MKVRRTLDRQIVFRFSRNERRLFQATLDLYPRMPPPDRSAQSQAEEPNESSRLLEEALAEHRSQTRGELRGWLADPVRWTAQDGGWLFRVSEAEAETLLQVLNDIRLGSWVALGSPEEGRPPLTEQSAPHLWGMEVAGHFQIALLQALSEPGGSAQLSPS